MLQINCLFTFAIGSALATAAGDGLKAVQYHTQNSYFIFTLLHISLIVSPINVYILWEHTGFGTMFYYDASMHGIWPSVNIAALTLTGIAGFMVGRKLVRLNKELTAYTIWTSACSCIIAIVSCHYDRLLYSGGIRDFYDGKKYALSEFLQSELCRALIISTILILGPVFYAQIFWPRSEGYMTKARKTKIKWHCVKIYIQEGLATASLFTVAKLANITPLDWGWDRLMAIGVGHMTGFLLFIPIFLMSTRYIVTKRIDIRRSKQNATVVRRRRPSRQSSANNIPDEEDNYYEQEETSATLPSHGVNDTSNGYMATTPPTKQE